MFRFQLRPTFEVPICDSRLEAMHKLQAEFSRSGTSNRFLMHGEYGELHLPQIEHRLWSPHLSFYVSERDGKTLIHGRYAPRMEVWTFVWVVYLAMSFTAFFGFALAYSQWMLGQSRWGTWVALPALLVVAGLYVIACLGQQLSSDQMLALRSRFETILERAGVEKNCQ